ncbi:MAG TPA: acyloxyacyl hydrolase [Stellaceae bacterium]
MSRVARADRGLRIGTTAAIGAALALLLASPVAWAEDPALLAVGLGVYDLEDHSQRQVQLRVEYRFAEHFLSIVSPVAGALVTNRQSFYGYGGVRLDLAVGQHFVLMPVAAIGYWRRGNGENLGSGVEFKTGIELAYRFDDAARLGIAFDHISNAGLGLTNPGVESLLLVYSIPLGAVK